MLILLEDEDVARDIPKELIHSGVIEMPVIEPIDFTKPNLPFPPEPTKTKLYRYKFPRKYELVLSEDVNHKRGTKVTDARLSFEPALVFERVR